MKKLFIPFEIALKLKELGFDELCYGRFLLDGELKSFQAWRNSECMGCSSPFYQQAIDWIYKMSEGDLVVAYDPSNTIETINSELMKAVEKLINSGIELYPCLKKLKD